MFSDILRPAGSNPGGNAEMLFAPAADLLNYPLINNLVVTQDAQFRLGRRWLRLQVIENKLGFDEDQSEDVNGTIYKISIKGILRGDAVTLRQQLYAMSKCKTWIARIRDNGGMIRVVAAPDQLLGFNYKFAAGESMGDLKAYSFEFYGSFSRPAAIVA